MLLKRNRRAYLIITALLSMYFGWSQNRDFAQHTIETLCADSFAGRGYVDKGDLKAASYIANQFKTIGLKPFGSNYFQPFTLGVNTIENAKVSLDGIELKPGYDFLTSPGSASASVTAPIYYISQKKLESSKGAKLVSKAISKGCVPVLDQFDVKNEVAKKNLQAIYANPQLKNLVFLKPSMLWSVARDQSNHCELWLVDSIFNQKTDSITINVRAEFIKNYKSQNVIGLVPGTEFPDSVVIFCGHYDHLGKMGDAIFYGANDNASGIAMLLDMAKYFVENPQKYSIAFIAFAGEEAGLVGSKYYVENPPITLPLAKTKFVFNMDLMGNGEAGATVVNGSVFTEQFNLLTKINSNNDYLPVVKTRGKAANSDHYFFTEAGIPSFFMYTMGDYTYYHIPNDNAQNLHLGPFYDKTFLLIRDFIIAINQ
jgi:aminopeptidase YwaD